MSAAIPQAASDRSMPTWTAPKLPPPAKTKAVFGRGLSAATAKVTPHIIHRPTPCPPYPPYPPYPPHLRDVTKIAARRTSQNSDAPAWHERYPVCTSRDPGKMHCSAPPSDLSGA